MAYEDDDVLVARESHPITLTLLFIGCFALIAAITVSVKQLGVYVNPETRSQLNNFTITATKMAENDMPALLDKADAGAEQDY